MRNTKTSGGIGIVLLEPIVSSDKFKPIAV